MDYLTWVLSGLLVIITVSIHYETMMLVSDRVMPWAQKHFHNRRVIAVAITGLLLGHIAEIWVYALATMVAMHFPVMGSVQGDFNNSWSDFLYLSSVNYSSLGNAAIRLTGPVRAIVCSETLIGMMMIAWSSSFTYLKMEQIWRRHHQE